MISTKDLLLLPLKFILNELKLLFLGGSDTLKQGAQLDSRYSYGKYLNGRNTGLLLDGNNLRLSEKDSFQNVCVMARIGMGKTSRYIIPNVLNKAKHRCSLVINDPKGEVYDNTSAYLKKYGFNIIVIDPENISRSSFFNPLMEAKNEIELEQIAEILVRSGTSSTGSAGKDDFWIQGAIRFVSLFIRCLKHAGEVNPAWFNLHNLYYLFQNFGEDGRNLDTFMSRYTIFPDNPTDRSLWNEWRGVLTGNKEGVQSFVLNAITSLRSLSNKNIATLTAKSDIQLENIKKKKTAIFVITPAQHGEYYGFLTSLFFRSVFNACMRELPSRSTLPVYVLYDEFAHSTIPHFISTANTIRGYGVSLSVILQSVSQLRARYGHDAAEAMQGGFASYLTYAGADQTTARFFEERMGKVRERNKRNSRYDLDEGEYREYNLMNANEIRTIQEQEAILISGNRQPVKLKTIPYFENWSLKRLSKHGAYTMPNKEKNLILETVGLE